MKLSFKITFNTPTGASIAQVIHLNKDTVQIGRADSDLTLSEGSVSRRHALLYQDAKGNLRIRDERSRNGTWIFGDKVVDAPLKVGSRIQIGSFTIAILSFSPETKSSEMVIHTWPEMFLAHPDKELIKK